VSLSKLATSYPKTCTSFPRYRSEFFEFGVHNDDIPNNITFEKLHPSVHYLHHNQFQNSALHRASSSETILAASAGHELVGVSSLAHQL